MFVFTIFITSIIVFTRSIIAVTISNNIVLFLSPINFISIIIIYSSSSSSSIIIITTTTAAAAITT